MNTFNDLKNKLSDTDVEELENLLCSRCGEKTKRRFRSMLNYGTGAIPYYGILQRLERDESGWSYTAGQSYPDEIRTVRGLIIGGRL